MEQVLGSAYQRHKEKRDAHGHVTATHQPNKHASHTLTQTMHQRGQIQGAACERQGGGALHSHLHMRLESPAHACKWSTHGHVIANTRHSSLARKQVGDLGKCGQPSPLHQWTTS